MSNYWYRIWWCPVCGREGRVRVYGPKPADPTRRVVVSYCGCMNSLFA